MRSLSSAIARSVFPALLVLAAGSATLWAAPPNSEQRSQLDRAKLAVRAAGRLLDAGRATQALEQIKKAQVEVAALTAEGVDPDVVALAEPVHKQLKELYVLLELEGLAVPAMPAPKPKEEMKPDEPGLGTPPVPANGLISFAKQVAPLLTSKCGRCHIDDAKGKISMTTYTALMAGSPDDGAIILPSKGTGSRLVEVIESGDMPRGGGKITKEEMDLLVKWIDQGAKNDGPAADTPLRQLSAAARPTPAPIVLATGNEKIKFGLDIAPVLVEQCGGCHISDDRADLSLATFTSLMRGGESGPAILAGKPAESLLLQKLKGTAGAQMPLQRPPLPAEVIAKFETWISEGAKFDGDGADLPMQRVADVARARNLPAAELSSWRVELANQTWRLGIPDDKASQVTSEHLLVMGNVGETALDEFAQLAEAQFAKLAAILPAREAGLIKGRVTLFVFANRYDYVEFGTMIEKRDLPKTWLGHWQYDAVNPYLTLLATGEAKDSFDTLLATQLISLAIANRGDGAAPRWFAEGIGRALAAKADPKDPLVGQWDQQLVEALSRMSKPDDFLTGKLSPEDTDAASYSFAKHLLTSTSRFNSLLKALDGGAAFDDALRQAYGGTAEQLSVGWARSAARGK